MSETTEQEADWIAALRKECGQTSQAKAGQRLGVSGSTVNQVLKGNYRGDMARIQGLVEGELMHATVHCPVLGEIGRNRCFENQRRPLAATNPTRVALYKACPTCPNYRG
ncbi:helix-turn-helix domain-containing protein [Salinisphaera hydrothermalis]|uniref:helix-turn-helix domain-containing protein n=1 Tax=Salinisphaera hydrothermalis TaxID=563188 RepID=UPI00333EAE95